mmetsp:Transcript_74408/g.162756  ORF Transcript_74408/g.162756 Transcript_74408/m.162756 type:complete len:628 (-) Transcript_74408:13-1896(-)
MAGGATSSSSSGPVKRRGQSPNPGGTNRKNASAAAAAGGSAAGDAASDATVATTGSVERANTGAGGAAAPAEHSWTRRLLGGGVHLTIVVLLGVSVQAGRSIWGILYPIFPDVDPATKVPLRKFSNLVEEGDELTARLWISNAATMTGFRKSPEPFLELDFNYSWQDFKPSTKTANLSVEAQNLSKGVAPILVAEVLHKKSKRVISAQGGLVKALTPPEVVPKWKLLTGDLCPEAPDPIYRPAQQIGSTPPPRGKSLIGKGIPAMQVRLVLDTMAYPLPYKRAPYLPQLFVDEFGLTDDQLIKLNDTGSSAWSSEVSFDLMGAPRWRFQEHMEMSLKQQEAFWGKDSEEMLQIRDLYANTPPLLLAITMVVSVLHMIFEGLAFKSDVEFFQDCDPEILNTYVSIQSIVVGIFMQIVLLLYLMDENTNMIVLVTSAGSILVDVWKVRRAMKVEWSKLFGFLPCPCLVSKVKKEKVDNFDSVAMKWLGLILSPGIVGFAIYSLVFDCHRSWYSYFLMVSSSCVYSLGFVLMTPQVFINYKHKTVAYLPWRKFIFRAISTFIDDLFALIIRMPTMHRLSCFRDDIVFIIYLYQRQIYKVDTTREFDEDGYAAPAVANGAQDSDKEGKKAK